MTTRQGETSTLQALQVQEASLAKRLAGAEGRLKTFQAEYAKMSGMERDVNVLVRRLRESDVVRVRGQLDQVKQQIREVQSGNVSSTQQVIARVENGPVIVTDVPATVSTTEPALTIFGLTPTELRGPAEFILLLPLILALSRWIWRRSPARPIRENSLEGNPQITRLEQAVESIAIQVERIGEAQRYSAKLLAERPAEPVKGDASPRRVKRPVITPVP